MISRELEYLINSAIRKANLLKHEFLTLETVLLALLEDKALAELLEEHGANLSDLKVELENFLKDENNFSLLTDEEIEELSKEHFADENLRKLAKQSGVSYQPELSMALQRSLQRAALQLQSSGKSSIGAIHLLLAMMQEEESQAIYLLKKQGIERLQLVEAVAHGLDKPINAEEVGNLESKPEKKREILEEYTINLNQKARNGQIDPLIGREKEVERLVHILCRRRKNNPLIVGDAGVGKTALAEGLAWAIIQKRVPEILQDAIVYSMDLPSLLAGTKYRGDFEGRFKNLVKALEAKAQNGEKPILFIDELHTVMGAGATSGGTMDASNMLKPLLEGGTIRCLGSTTHEEYRKFVEKDHAFGRRFQKIDLEEPTHEEAIKILQGLKPKFEEFHLVSYADEVLKAAVMLAEKYISDRRLPDKAIDLIDEAGAAKRIKGQKGDPVLISDLELVVSSLAKVPPETVATDEKEKLRNLKRNLSLLIFGQDDALEKVSNAILLARSGLGPQNKPLASFLFAGPTGVGKTELARQLAFNLGVHFERFDMSEYMEKHAVAKLIGAPPGYVGFEQGGVLTDAIKKNPYSVLLLDEIEKAHEDVFNILLQVMERGALTDSHGRTTDFKNVILIMTTNAGAKDMEAGSIGLSKMNSQDFSQAEFKRDKAIKQFFSPEFRNRLDGIVNFSKLGISEVISIVRKFLLELERQLADKKIRLETSDEVVEWMAQKGFDPKMGARPLARFIDQKIKHPLSHEILFGKLQNGGVVRLELEQDELRFQFRE